MQKKICKTPNHERDMAKRRRVLQIAGSNLLYRQKAWMLTREIGTEFVPP